MNYSLLSKHVAGLAMLGVLAACGGGGGAGGGTASTATFSGTAAVGAPLPGGKVVVTDATGATVGNATTGADGSYTLSFDLAKFSAPFVITVTGAVGDASIQLVSVQPTSGSATVNITPITHAIAALLSSTGNPADLVANIATDKGNLTAANINAKEQGFRDALAANMTAAGLTASDNLLSGAFNAKFDKLLDNVRIEVTTSGEIHMSSSAGAAVDDLGNSWTTPAAAKTVVLAKGTVPSATNAANLPAPATSIGIDSLEATRLALNACFAGTVATRNGSGSAACANVASSSYLNDGRDRTQEFSGWINDAGNDSMQFQKPEILRQLSTIPNHERLIVRLSAKRSDGLNREIITVAENNPAGTTGWTLVGNQRLYATFVNAVASKRINVNFHSVDRYETGLNLYVNDNAAIDSVVVTGPGLPASGMTLKRLAGCEYLGIADGTGTAPYCTAYYHLRSIKFDGIAFTPSAASAYLFTTLTEAEISAIKPLDLYKFVITQTPASGGGTLTYWNRLRSRPLTIEEIARVKFVDFTPSSIAMVTNATMYTGGAAPTLSWTVPDNAPRPYLASFFHENGKDSIGVPTGSNSVTIPCSGNTDCTTGGSYKTGLNTGGAVQYVFQTIARNQFDTQIFTNLSK